jgi:hypothetical protein
MPATATKEETTLFVESYTDEGKEYGMLGTVRHRTDVLLVTMLSKPPS